MRASFLAALILTLGACAPVQIPDAALPGYYASVEARLRASGRMRTDVAPSDARFSRAALIEDFIRIALYDEYAVAGGRFVPRQSPATLRKWQGPVRVSIISGPSVSEATRRSDAQDVATYMARLARLTRLDMRPAERDAAANFTILFLDRAEQRGFAGKLQAEVSNVPPAVVNAFLDSPPEAFCVAYSLAGSDAPDQITWALILVKAEQSGLMRQACIHEEMAQALGLTNDSRDARPSIFNDDDEFALLTKHDELLLRMLYDPRLKPGMSEAEVRPLIDAIAQDAIASGGAQALVIN